MRRFMSLQPAAPMFRFANFQSKFSGYRKMDRILEASSSIFLRCLTSKHEESSTNDGKNPIEASKPSLSNAANSCSY